MYEYNGNKVGKTRMSYKNPEQRGSYLLPILCCSDGGQWCLTYRFNGNGYVVNGGNFFTEFDGMYELNSSNSIQEKEEREEEET